jgi:hypothetical protein
VRLAMLHQERSGSTARCDSLQRMEEWDEEFESRLRALERLPGGEGRRGEEGFHDQRRGRRGRRRGGGGDCEGAGRGVKEVSLLRSVAGRASVSPVTRQNHI